MTDQQALVQVAILQERHGALDQKISAAHTRMDKVESGIATDLTEIKQMFQGVMKDIKDLNAWMNRSKGWQAAAYVGAGMLGSGLTLLIKYLFSLGGK